MPSTASGAPGHPWVIVGCGRLKHVEPRPAADLYGSPYITNAVAWARSVTTEDRLLILSAKHGLIDGRTVIEPYDVSFQHGPADQVITPERLAEQVDEFGITGPAITLAGAEYRRRLAVAAGGRVQPHNPFADLLHTDGKTAGMGYQMQALKAWHGRVPGEG